MDTQICTILEKAEQFSSSCDGFGVCEHTDDIRSGDIFIANADGIKYIDLALRKGASLIVSDSHHRVGKAVAAEQLVVVNDLQAVARELVQGVYRKALENLQLIGITGTNGKTSTASLVCELLNRVGCRTGYIGTLGFGVIGESITKGRNTTPDVVTLHRYLQDLYQQGCKAVVMEVSSHGIALERIYGLAFHVAAFTNLSRDHLDFHGTQQAYEETKRSFFSDYVIDKLVINLDDRVGLKIFDEWQRSHEDGFVGVSRSHSGDNVIKYANSGSGAQGLSQITIEYCNQSFELSSRLQGDINIVNLTMAIAICHSFGIAVEGLIDAASYLSPVPGRLECVSREDGGNVFIDYAHTPAGVESILLDRSLNLSNSWCVLGCGGDRDTGKRADMAAVAQLSEHVMICDDNVRNDSATQIIIDMLTGVNDKTGVTICRDRKHAIRHVLDAVDSNENVFLLGKGDESVIDYGVKKLAHKDRDVVMQYGGRDGY